MFHRSYTPSGHLDHDNSSRKQNEEEQKNHGRSASLDFELYSPLPPNNHNLYRHQQQQRPQSSSSIGASSWNNYYGHHQHQDNDENEQLIQWFLFQSQGTISFRLSTQKPILVGSGSECDIRFLHQPPQPYSHNQTPATASAPVEKRHAVLAFEPASNCFTVRDLNTTNGTFVNNRRLCGDHPETVSNLDVLRFGYEILLPSTHPTLYEIRSASLSAAAGTGGGGPSSLPPTLNNYNRNNKLFSNRGTELSRSISTEDNHRQNNHYGSIGGLPPRGSPVGGASVVGAIVKKGGSPFLPRKALLTKKNSDPGGGASGSEGGLNNNSSGGGIFSERLAQFQRRSSGGSGGGIGGIINSPYDSTTPPSSSTVVGFNNLLEKQCGETNNVMHQGGRGGTSGICSPSLTLDSGRGSSSAPSSPAKEMSPVQMMASATTATSATSPTSVTGGGGSTSSQSHTSSPVFARKLSRPMEYLLGGQGSPSELGGGAADPHSFVGVDPHYSVGLSSGNYTSFCSGSEPISFATSGVSSGSGASANFNNQLPLGGARSGSATSNVMNNNNLNCAGGGFPSDCEILQITEDFEVDGADDVVARKDSLEEEEEINQQVMFNGDKNNEEMKKKPQFLVGGDIMPADLNVPNEVFGPVSHAEILNRNMNLGATATKNINCTSSNNTAAVVNNLNLNREQPAGGKQGNNKPVPLLEGTYTTTSPAHHPAPTSSSRARSSSGGDGGSSNRSTPLSALYGTPHWWPDSPPPEEDNGCPPPPNSSTNASPFKKPFLLNNNVTNRLKGNSSSSSLADPSVKDLSLESTHSQKSNSHNNRPPSPTSPFLPPSSSSLEAATETPTMGSSGSEVKKLTPMAFTIDLSDNSGGGDISNSEAVEAKKAAIAERLSKFAPRHRRNASLTKSDASSGDVVGTSGEGFSASSPLPNNRQTKSSSLGRTQHQQRQSSVNAAAAESSLAKCASLPKKLSSSQSGGGKHPSGGSNNDSGLRSLSPETISSTTSSSSRSRPPAVTDSSKAKKNNLASDNNSGSMGRKSGGNNKSGGGSRGGTPVTRRTTTPSEGLRSSYQRGGDKAENVPLGKLNDLSKGPTTTTCTTPNKAVSPLPTAGKVDKEDTISEAGTYTVEKEAPEVQCARENIEEIFGLTNGEADEEDGDKENNLVAAANKSVSDVVIGAEPGTRDWVREWAELAAQQHQQKKHHRPELPDSQYFLRETETLVSAIQERVSKHMKSGGGSGGGNSDSDDDDPTLSHHTPVKSQSQHSTPTNTAAKRRPPSRTSPFHRESSVLSDSGYAIGYQSDSSNEGSSSNHHHHHIPPNTNHLRGGAGVRGASNDLITSQSSNNQHGSLTQKMNPRAFNIRRGGGRTFGYESTTAEPYHHHQLNNQQTITTSLLPLNNTRGISPRPVNSLSNNSKCNNIIGGATNSASSPHFARNDGGRFSLRMAKSRTPPAQMPPPAPRQNSYTGGGGEPHGRMMVNGHGKSESREQSVGSSVGGSGKKYTAAGKVLNNSTGGGSNKKGGGNRSNSTLTAKEVELANWKRRKNYDPMKAAAEGKKGVNKKNGAGSATGAESSGVEENTSLLPPIASPKVNRREAMMTKSLSFHQESYSPKCASEDEDMIYIVDEMDSSHSNSPNHLSGGGAGGGMAMTRSYHEDVMYYGMSGSTSSMRPKNKLEALDNLVIATIHSLSNKVRTSSRHLLEKLQTQHTNDENGALLEEMVSQLKELEAPSNNSSPNKSPSRELSGTLKNLKKLEQVVLVLDKVLCDGFESDING